MSFVQRWPDIDAGTRTSAAAVVSGATPGNILLAIFSVRGGADAGSLTDPAPGYVTLDIDTETTDTSHGIAVYIRPASGDANDNVALTWNDNGHALLAVYEYDGVGTLSYDDHAYDYANPGPVSSGNATATTSNGQAIAILTFEATSNWYEGGAETLTPPAGFTFDGTPAVLEVASGSRPGLAVASMNYTAPGDISATFSSTGGMLAGAFSMIVLLADSGGGGGSSPVPKIAQQL